VEACASCLRHLIVPLHYTLGLHEAFPVPTRDRLPGYVTSRGTRSTRPRRKQRTPNPSDARRLAFERPRGPMTPYRAGGSEAPA